MGAALGLGLQPGELVTSIGTSGTAYAVTTTAAADPTGLVAGFADATGRFLPLVGHGQRRPGAGRGGRADRHRSGRAVRPGADRRARRGRHHPAALPGRRADAEPAGRHRRAARPHHPQRDPGQPRPGRGRGGARHAGRRGRPDRRAGRTAGRVLLIGGGARSEAVRRLAPGIFGVPVLVPAAEEYVALGAARQAAWALAGTPEPPPWPRRLPAEFTAPPQPAVRERLAWLRRGHRRLGRPRRGRRAQPGAPGHRPDHRPERTA